MRILFGLVLLLCVGLITSSALAFSEDADRGRMEIWTETQGEFSFVFFGSRGTMGIGQQRVGQCPAANSVLNVTNADIAANAAVKDLVTLSGEVKLPRILERLEVAHSAEAQKLSEQRALACLAYWTGAIREKSAYLRIQAALNRAMERLAWDGDRPSIYLLDSPYKVYSVGVDTHGETNADQIAQRLRSMGDIRVLTANTSSTWQRTDDVIAANPVAVVIHFSAFETDKLPGCDPLRSAVASNCIFLLSSLIDEVLEKTEAGVVIYSRVPDICGRFALQNLANQIDISPTADGRHRVVIVPMADDAREMHPFRWDRVAKLAHAFAAKEDIDSVATRLGSCVLG